MGSFMGARMGKGGAMVFGRRTYEDFSSFGLTSRQPFSAVLKDAQKYVASTTLREPLQWRNSTLLEGDAADAVARLKEQSDENLVVLGSGELVRSLMGHDLVDEFVLMIHPLVLGSGRRLFADGGPPAPCGS